MNPIEIVYDGYVESNKNVDAEETTKVTDSLLAMIESLLPGSEKVQNILFAECLNLPAVSQKQGFIAGFGFAMELIRAGRI